MNNQKLKNLVCKCAALIVSFLVTMIITRIVVMRIGDETYGFYSLSIDFINYALIISIALNSMSSRFITISYYADEMENVNKYFNSIFFANVGLATFLLGPIFLIIYRLEYLINISEELVSDVKILFILMSINFLITIVSSVFNTATFLKNRIDLDSICVIQSYVVRVAVIIFCFRVFTPRIWHVGLACLMSSLYVFLMNIYFVRTLTPQIKLVDKRSISFKHIKEVASSGAWNCLTRIGSVLLNGLDLLLANISVSSAAMGVLSVSKTLPKSITSALSNFAAAFTPEITIAYANKDKGNIIKSLYFAIKMCGILSIVVQSVVIVLGKQIYMLWFPNQDSTSLYILSIVAMLGYVILMPFENLYNVFTVTNRVKNSSIYLFVESLITIGIVICGTFFIDDDFKKLMIIAGTSSLAEIIRGLFFLPIYSAICINVKKSTFYKPLFRILTANLFTVGVGFKVCNILENITWFWLIIKAFLLCVVAFVFWWIIVLNREERILFYKKLKEVIYVT